MPRPTNATLRIEVSQYGKQGPIHGTPKFVNLRVEDDVSGVCVIDVELTADQVLDLLQGSSYKIDGFLTRQVDRLGKHLQVDHVEVPREVTDGKYGADADAAVEAWAQNQHWPEWQERDVRKTNAGYKVVRRAWFTVTES